MEHVGIALEIMGKGMGGIFAAIIIIMAAVMVLGQITKDHKDERIVVREKRIFQVEILQNGLRKKIAQMITVAATKDFDTAIILTKDYLKQLQQERNHAEEAIEIVKTILAGE